MKFAGKVQLIAFMLMVVLSAGCGSESIPKEDDTVEDLNHIARAYGFIVTGDFHVPRKMEEITEMLAKMHKSEMNPPPEEVLVSSRDGQPYVIILGANLGEVASHDILAYEKNGVEGSRYVLTMNRDVKLVSDADFYQATFAMGHRPSRSGN